MMSAHTIYIWAAELDVVRPSGTIETVRLCDGPLPPFDPGDPDRPYAIYRQRLAGPPAWSVGVSADLSRLAGDVAGGELSILNGDSAYSWMGGLPVRSVRVRRGHAGLPWAAWTPVIDGRGGVAAATLSGRSAGRIIVPLGDLRDALARSVDDNVYGGGNAGPTGYDGAPDDIKGRRKPLCLGTPKGVTPVRVNAQSAAWQYDAGPAGGAGVLYDRGDLANMTLVATASSAAFDAAAPTATQYIDDPSRGLLRLGGMLGGDLTIDPAGGRVAAGSTAGSAARWLLGLSAAGTIGATLSGWVGPTIGAYWAECPEIKEAVDLMARSAGGWIVPDGLGRWRFGRLAAPAGGPAATITEHQVLDIGVDDADLNAPVYKITVRGRRNYSPITSSSAIGAAALGTSREAWLREEWRSATAESAATRAIWGDHARAVEIITALTNTSDMEALAADLLAALGRRTDGTPRRSLFIRVPMTTALLALSLGTAVHLRYPREGIDDDLMLMGLSIMDRHTIKLRLWG